MGEEKILRFSPRPNRANEIAWQPWGEGAFQRAAREGKPVLLSISAVWCHWCHVMDETSYSDGAVIDLVNERYVPIRVDSDRHPDINSRYNQGGWPTTAFLSPDGLILAGATYLPPESMRKALERISDLYYQHGAEIARPEEEILLAEVREEEPGLDLVRETGELVLRAWDRAYGGLGSAPKFPQPDAIALGLELFADENKREYLDFALSTLKAMIRGNLLDREEGGFFRYSTTRDWSIPHYEKMLSDNAALLSVLIKAYGTSGEEIFRRTALETAAYIRRTLSDGVSRFYGSQDADEEYYLLKAGQREGRTPPTVDRTVYTDLAAGAAMSFLEAGTALGRDEYLSQALADLEFLWSGSYREGDGMAHYHDEAPHRWGLLDDQVVAALAFLKAYGYTGDGVHLQRAEILLRLILDQYWDDANCDLLDTASVHSLPGLKPEPAGPFGRSQAAEAMLNYWAFSGDEGWHRSAGRILAGRSRGSASLGIMATPLAKAANLYLRGPLLVKVTCRPGETGRAFLKASLLSPRPRLILILSKVGRIIEDKTRAEVCTMEACHFRTAKPNELAGYLEVREELLEEVEES